MNAAKLEQMKIEARGNAEKIARYMLAKREYDGKIAELFNKESGVDYFETPSEMYVNDMEAKAAATGDDKDVERAAILRDRYKHSIASQTAHVNWRLERGRLRNLLASGEKVTQNDVEQAGILARQDGSLDNITLFSQLKRAVENGEE